jgi:hypothetical protein
VAVEVALVGDDAKVLVLGGDATYALIVSSDGNVESTVPADLGEVAACPGGPTTAPADEAGSSSAGEPTTAPAGEADLPPATAPADDSGSLPNSTEPAK